MVSEAKTVSEFLKVIPDKRKNACAALRNLCRETLKGYEESMDYKMPSYKRNNAVEVAFNSQKNHICLYFLIHDVMSSNQELIKSLNHGKGCIRYSNPDKIDFEIVKKLLTETYNSKSKPC
ncbi:DUF1801 domain-containing protein [soil metagenome]